MGVKSKMRCGEVRPSTRPEKKIMKLYCVDGKEKLVHAGAKGYGNNYSDEARKSFKARHKCDTAQRSCGLKEEERHLTLRTDKVSTNEESNSKGKAV
jgi:phage gp16-like protein